MSGFKNAVKKDVKSVFINHDEFAESHTIDGVSVVCIVDKDITDGRDGREINFEGVFLNTLTIYVSTADIENRPVEGQYIDFDGETYHVLNVSDEDGILAIIVEVNAQ